MTADEVTTAHVPAYAGTGLPATEAAGILHRLDPAALQEAGAAHTALGRELDTMAAQLTRESQTLAQHWSGPAARRALAQFQRLHTQTATLAVQATRTGAVLTWLGTHVVPAVRDPSDIRQAQQYLTSLSAALVRANRALPPEIGVPAPAQLTSAAPAQPSPGNPGNPGSPQSTINPAGPKNVDRPGNLLNLSSVAPASRIGPANLMGTSNPPSGPVSPAGAGHPASPGHLAASASAPADADTAPALLISRTTGPPTHTKQPADSRPAGQDSGLSGGALPLQPAPGPAFPAALTPTTSTAASHNTPGALPMAGGVPSPSDHERHRKSWAPEDRNPWGLPDTCVPPVIEGL